MQTNKFSSGSDFTLVPIDFNNPNSHYRVMCELFEVAENEKVCSCNIEQWGVKVLFLNREGDKTLPSVCRYLMQLHKLDQYNKLIVEYNIERNSTIIVLAEGERLLVANRYHTVDFGSAIYFILELLRQNQINPQQTVVNLYAAPSIDELNMLQDYVKGVKVCAV